MKLSSWPEIGSDGDVLLTPYVPKRITGYDDDDDDECKLPDDGPSGPKHVGANMRYFNVNFIILCVQ